MRKSQQRSRPHQIYDALTAKSSSRNSPGPYAVKGRGTVSLISRAHNNPEGLPENREAISELLSGKEQLQISLLKMVRCEVGV
jgi:hypothetical protein